MELINTPIHVVLGFDQYTEYMIRRLQKDGAVNICVLDYHRTVGGMQHDSVFYFAPGELKEYIAVFDQAIFHKYLR